MSDVPGPHSDDEHTERKKEQSLGFLFVAVLGTILAAVCLFLAGGDPGWLVPISFVGGIFILAAASNFAFLNLVQKLQQRIGERTHALWFACLVLVVAYILFSMGPGPNLSG